MQDLELRAQEELKWTIEQIARSRPIDMQLALSQHTTKKTKVIIAPEVPIQRAPPPPPPPPQDITIHLSSIKDRINILSDRINRKKLLFTETYLTSSEKILIDDAIGRNQLQLQVCQQQQTRLVEHVILTIARKQQLFNVLTEDEDVDSLMIGTIASEIAALELLRN